MTPWPRSSAVSPAIATYAPRILKAPVGWSDSALSHVRCSRGPKATSGVRTATPASVAAASRIAGSATSASSRPSYRSSSTAASIGRSVRPLPGSGVSSAPNTGSHGRCTLAIESDPVCGMQVDTETSQLNLEHDGKTYWFCGRGCLLEFRDDPERFLDPE